jgi:hypothetical protein
LNSACDACVCTNVTVNGTVRNEDGVLLNNATIALSEFPFNILARTDIAGHFKLRGICVAQEKIIVERNGYLPQVLNAKKIDSTSFTISASLEAIGNELLSASATRLYVFIRVCFCLFKIIYWV